MKKRDKILIALLGTLATACFGCDDDGTIANAAKDVCTGSDQCESGLCLPNGKCAMLVARGENCDAATVCADSLECISGICGGQQDDNTDPGKNNDDEDDPDSHQQDECANLNCKNTQVCIEGACKDITWLNAGDPCDVSSLTEICYDGLTCFKGTCQTQQEIDNAGFCTTDADCEGQPTYKTCLDNGRCGTYSQLGYPCNATHRWCANGLECDDNDTCIRVAFEGEPCSETDSIFCDKSRYLTCLNGYCRNLQLDQEKGDSCNDWTICKNEYKCLNDVCSEVHNEGEPCNENDLTFCNNGLICQNGICSPLGSTCEKSEDCTEKDMFCCKSIEECGVLNRCITYDDVTTHDEMCLFKTKPGIFEAQIQCQWQPTDIKTNSNWVEIPPLVGHFGNKDNLDTVIVFYSQNSSSGDTTIRIINPETCEPLESIAHSLRYRWYNYPAAADLDGDGLMEFVMVNSNSRPVAFKWNASKQKHEVMWTGAVAGGAFLLIYDVNGDGKPEVIAGNTVYNGQDGTTIFNGNKNWSHSREPSIGNLDNDPNGIASLLLDKNVYKWNISNNSWKQVATLPIVNTDRHFLAYGDFGSPGKTAADFNYKSLDGIPEIVNAGRGVLQLFALIPKTDNSGTYDVQTLMEVKFTKPLIGNATIYGGPITIGDYDNDGLPEIGVASSGYYGVYDPLCTGYKEGECADKNVLWERWSQDASSGVTGSTVFDFDGDGQAEAVYADECFTRVYDGKTGKVLFSSRHSSGTAHEAPVVADVDGDGSAEIVMGSAQPMTCYNDAKSKVNDGVDPIHEGIRCLDDEDCPTGKGCRQDIGLCTCTTDAECNTQYIKDANGKSTLLQQYACTDPIHPDVGMMVNKNNGSTRTVVKDIGSRPTGWKSGDYKVCRATRVSQTFGRADLIVFKDRLDRWVSSRALWNQHAYNIINIEDNGKVPTPAQWLAKWLAKSEDLLIDGTTEKRPKYNNYRLNEQGLYGAGRVPDITGRFEEGTVCGQTAEGKHVISGKLCNRGTKPVSTKLPASFFYYDETKDDHLGERLCTSLTDYIVGVGECSKVGCEISEEELEALAGKRVIMVTNLDENGQQSTVECNYNNNNDTILIDKCASDPIVIY